ncbi:MAG: hypothetical protein BGO41_13225 [Clostridiales bacterium 38-18]|nr:MAG: hypothetical protein BGO41_13225 [Clostridiales bacterium 38-18]
MRILTKKRVVISIVSILFIAILGMGVWFTNSYAPDEQALDALNGNSEITVSDTADYIYFNPNSALSKGIVFYPGAKVAPEAYNVLALEIAKHHIPVVIVKMPLNFAIFDINKADAIKSKLGISQDWVLMGHSLGGSMAAKYLYDHPESFSGIIFLASYSASDLSQANIDVLSIWGTKDAFVTQEKIEATKDKLPAGSIFQSVEGGNHSQFGNYGFQNGDNEADIDSSEQRSIIVDAIVTFMTDIIK